MIKKKANKTELLKYEEITKEYAQIIMEKETSKKMKIIYNNPDDYNKTLEIESTDDDMVEVRTKVIHLKSKFSDYIRLTFNMPKTVANYNVSVIVKNKTNNEIEEILKFPIQVVDKLN